MDRPPTVSKELEPAPLDAEVVDDVAPVDEPEWLKDLPKHIADNVRARLAFEDKFTQAAKASAAAAMFMQASGCKWNLEWTV